MSRPTTDPDKPLPATREQTVPVMRRSGFELTEEHKDVLKKSIAKDLDDTEFEVFLMRCKAHGVNPFLGQLVPVVYHKKDPSKRQMIIQAGIDFKRARANTSKEYEGVAYRRLLVQTKGGEKLTINHSEYDPGEHVKIISATVGVYRKGFRQPEERTALFDRFNKKENLWQSIPDHMILKVAESHALSAAFPEQLRGIYIPEEVDWANPPIDVTSVRRTIETTDGRKPFGRPKALPEAGHDQMSLTPEPTKELVKAQSKATAKTQKAAVNEDDFKAVRELKAAFNKRCAQRNLSTDAVNSALDEMFQSAGISSWRGITSPDIEEACYAWLDDILPDKEVD